MVIRVLRQCPNSPCHYVTKVIWAQVPGHTHLPILAQDTLSIQSMSSILLWYSNVSLLLRHLKSEIFIQFTFSNDQFYVSLSTRQALVPQCQAQISKLLRTWTTIRIVQSSHLGFMKLRYQYLCPVVCPVVCPAFPCLPSSRSSR